MWNLLLLLRPSPFPRRKQYASTGSLKLVSSPTLWRRRRKASYGTCLSQISTPTVVRTDFRNKWTSFIWSFHGRGSLSLSSWKRPSCRVTRESSPAPRSHCRGMPTLERSRGGRESGTAHWEYPGRLFRGDSTRMRKMLIVQENTIEKSVSI
jgi:hypothetical protein